MSDKFHITALKTGDIRLFEDFYQTYYPVLCNYAATITKNQTMAEDVVSDVFMKFLEGRDSITIETSLKSYLFKSTYNQCLNALKHERVQNQYRDFFLHHPPLFDDGTDYPLSGVIENEIKDILQKTIEQLPEQCRKVFIMSRIDGMKNEEICPNQRTSIVYRRIENQK